MKNVILHELYCQFRVPFHVADLIFHFRMCSGTMHDKEPLNTSANKNYHFSMMHHRIVII